MGNTNATNALPFNSHEPRVTARKHLKCLHSDTGCFTEPVGKMQHATNCTDPAVDQWFLYEPRSKLQNVSLRYKHPRNGLPCKGCAQQQETIGVQTFATHPLCQQHSSIASRDTHGRDQSLEVQAATKDKNCFELTLWTSVSSPWGFFHMQNWNTFGEIPCCCRCKCLLYRLLRFRWQSQSELPHTCPRFPTCARHLFVLVCASPSLHHPLQEFNILLNLCWGMYVNLALY